MAEAHRFRGVIEAARGGGAVVLIPGEIATALGGLKQMRVTGTVNGVAYRSSTMPYGGRGLFMGVHKATHEAARAAIGDEARFEVVKDETPRTLELAPELAAALAAEPELRRTFEALSFSRRRELADPVAEARKPETRQARLGRTMARLRELSSG
ncbi:MAG: YdeI/OmpD-associated family protein [Candidatus Limnocylindria bacterium]